MTENIPEPAGGVEVLPPPTPEQLARGIVGDLMHTFRLSQGRPDSQDQIVEMLASEYAALPQHILEEAKPLVEARVNSLGIPSEHEERTEDEISSEYKKQLHVLLTSTKEVYIHGFHAEEELSEMAGFVASQILFEDERYQGEDRPNRDPEKNSDVHASILRDYIIDDKLHASPAMLAVRDRIRAAILTAKEHPVGWPLGEQLDHLIGEWQKNHPNESFWPQQLQG
jgi:hypothetical protein